MSNLIQNGNFSTPSIATNDYKYFDALTTQQLTDIVWTSPFHNTSLQNGSTAFSYPDPSIIRCSQFIGLQRDSTISQNFTVSQTGNYILTFFYTGTPDYDFNYALIFLDGIQVNSIQTSVFSWTSYATTFDISSVGTHNLLFQGFDGTNDYNIAITNVSLVLNNLFLNSDLSKPVLSPNTYVYVDTSLPNSNFTTQQQDQFDWIGTENLSLNNGTTDFNYPDPTNFTTNGQFVNFEQNSTLNKWVTILTEGTYSISFNYVFRQGYDPNPLQILLNGNVLDTLDVSTPNYADWSSVYIFSFPMSYLGDNLITIQGQAGNNANTAITNLNLVFAFNPNGPSPINPPISDNLVLNGDFSNPKLSPNSYVQGLIQNWEINLYVYLSNHPNGFGYSAPINQQIVCFTRNSYIVQNINITSAGEYDLTFYYAKHNTFKNNQLEVIFDGKILRTIYPTVTSWTKTTIQVFANKGIRSLKFKSVDITNNYVAIASVSLTPWKNTDGTTLNGVRMNVPYPYAWLDLLNSNKIKQSYFQGYYNPYYNGTGSRLQGSFVVDETGKTELIYVPPNYLPGFIDVNGNVIVRNKNLYVTNGDMLLINGNLYLSGRIYKNQNFSNNNTFLGNLAVQNYQSKIFSVSDLGRYNTAFGYRSTYDLLYGNYNTSLGNNSGNGLISQNFNTFIGNNTGVSNESLNFSTAIGYSSTITRSHQIIIGTSNENVYVPGGMNVYGNVYINGNISLINRNALYIYSDKSNSNFSSTGNLIITDNQNNEVLCFKNNKIGINKSSPTFDFDVDAMTRFIHSPIMAGTLIYSGEYNNNTGIGLKSLGNLIGGTHNTSYGPNSSANMMNGRQNSFFGSYSGLGLKNDSYNTGMGYYCMKDLSSSSSFSFTYNTAFGAFSLSSIIGTITNDISNNSAFGCGSMNYFNGSNNSSFGHSSTNNIIGNSNCGYGSYAMNFISPNIASNNCVYGANSLSQFKTMIAGSTINDNCIFGSNSLMGNVQGSTKSTINSNCIFGGYTCQKVNTPTFNSNSVFGNYNLNSISENSNYIIENTLFGYNILNFRNNLSLLKENTLFGTNILYNGYTATNSCVFGSNSLPMNYNNRNISIFGSNCCTNSTNIGGTVGITAIGSNANGSMSQQYYDDKIQRMVCLGANSLPICDGLYNVGIGYNSGYNIHNIPDVGKINQRINSLFIGANSGHGMYTSGTELSTAIDKCTSIGSNLSILKPTLNFPRTNSYIFYNLGSTFIGGYGGNVYIPGKLTIDEFLSTQVVIIASDYRIKKNIKNINGNIIHNLKPIKFYNKRTRANDFGFIAHEVQSQQDFSCLVSGVKDGEDLQFVNYNGFIAVNTKELQILKKEIKTMKVMMKKNWKKIEFIKNQKKYLMS